MKIRLQLLLFFCAFSIISTIYAQEAPLRNSQSESRLLKEYSRGKLITSGYVRINCDDLAVFSDRVEFTDRMTEKRQSLSLADISLINVKTGNHFLEGGFLGGLTGAILPLFKYRDQYVKPPAAEVYIISAAVGAGIGAFIGLLIDKNKTIYQTGTLFISDYNSVYPNPHALAGKYIPILKYSIFIN